MTCQACQAPVKRGTFFCPSCALKLMAHLISEDPECLKCENCGATYSGSEARVQRRLRQICAGVGFMSGPEAPGESVTPSLCWVCARLHYSAQSEKQEWTQ